MEKIDIIKTKVTAILFIMALGFPLSINSLHYVLYEHDHNYTHHHDISYTNTIESHSNCQWDFSVSDVDFEKITLKTTVLIFIKHIETKNLVYTSQDEFFFSLRAPPAFINIS